MKTKDKRNITQYYDIGEYKKPLNYKIRYYKYPITMEDFYSMRYYKKFWKEVKTIKRLKSIPRIYKGIEQLIYFTENYSYDNLLENDVENVLLELYTCEELLTKRNFNIIYNTLDNLCKIMKEYHSLVY